MENDFAHSFEICNSRCPLVRDCGRSHIHFPYRLKEFGELKANYVKIPNELVNDREISWKAKGLFCHMASKLDTYNFTVKSLASQFPDGKASIFSALDELKNSGWITYTRKAGGYGKYKLNTTILSKSDNRIESSSESDNRTKDRCLIFK